MVVKNELTEMQKTIAMLNGSQTSAWCTSCGRELVSKVRDDRHQALRGVRDFVHCRDCDYEIETARRQGVTHPDWCLCVDSHGKRVLRMRINVKHGEKIIMSDDRRTGGP